MPLTAMKNLIMACGKGDPGMRIPKRTILLTLAATFSHDAYAQTSKYYARTTISPKTAAATPATPPAASCGTLSANRSVSSPFKIGMADDLATAQSVCNGYRAANAKGSCIWVSPPSGNSDVKTVYYSLSTATISGNTNAMGASCL
jgi:hypothetical protein